MSSAQLSEPRELSLHGSLSFLGYEADPRLTKAKWMEDGAALATMDRALRFAIGDWVLFGETRYGEEHAQAIDATKLSYSSINSARWVASRIPQIRRRTNLSWSHHEAVASLPPEKQDELLDLAEHEGLDREHVRDLAREVKGLPPVPEMTMISRDEIAQLRNEVNRYRQEADEGLHLIDKAFEQHAKRETEQQADLRIVAKTGDTELRREYETKWNDPL